MKILSIETSCDETAVAVIEFAGDVENSAFSVLGHALYSQASQHAEFGGVYPNLAKREHQRNLVPLTREALTTSKFILNSSPLPDAIVLKKLLEREQDLLEQLLKTPELFQNSGIDAIAVTRGPGLEPALWVGINFAKTLSYLWDVPLVPVNHMEGHLFSVLVEAQKMPTTELFPALALLVSGGHTELVLLKNWFDYEILGRTRDDAVGEAFDKVARLLDLPYPGGPEISRRAEEARKSDTETPTAFVLPRPMQHTDAYDFSYSGLKTAVRRIIDQHTLTEDEKNLIAREFEDAALDVLITKTEKALNEYNPKQLIVAGGVIANKELRRRLAELTHTYATTNLLIPSYELATDNAIMIGIAGLLHFKHTPELFSVFNPETSDIKADGNWRVDR
jgi:N6-L-threonylcarbamoyladenine synthase